MLIIGATGDTVARSFQTRCIVWATPLKVLEIAANHFDPNFDPLFPRVLGHQVQFLSQDSVLGGPGVKGLHRAQAGS